MGSFTLSSYFMSHIFLVLLGYSFAGDGHFVLFGLCVSRCFFTHWKVLVNVLNGDGDDDEDEWVFRPRLTRSKYTVLCGIL